MYVVVIHVHVLRRHALLQSGTAIRMEGAAGSLVVNWITPSNASTLPYDSESNTRISCTQWSGFATNQPKSAPLAGSRQQSVSLAMLLEW